MFRIVIGGKVLTPATSNVGAMLTIQPQAPSASQLFVFQDSHLINVESGLAITVDEDGSVTMTEKKDFNAAQKWTKQGECLVNTYWDMALTCEGTVVKGEECVDKIGQRFALKNE